MTKDNQGETSITIKWPFYDSCPKVKELMDKILVLEHKLRIESIDVIMYKQLYRQALGREVSARADKNEYKDRLELTQVECDAYRCANKRMRIENIFLIVGLVISTALHVINYIAK